MPSILAINRLMGAPSPAQGKTAIPAFALGSNTETLITDQTGGTATLNPVPGGALSSGTTATTSFGLALDGYPFKVRAAFKVTTGGTSTAIVALYVGTTIVSGNKVATVTSQSLASISASGFLEATLIWDVLSQKLNGLQQSVFGTTNNAPAAITNTNIAVTTQAGLQFVLTANLGSNVTGSTFVITEFVLEAV